MKQKTSKNTILIVDDEEILKKSLTDVLSEDYDILDAQNGQDALEKLAKHADSIAVIVLDLIMPVMDGVEFLNLKKQNEMMADIFKPSQIIRYLSSSIILRWIPVLILSKNPVWVVSFIPSTYPTEFSSRIPIKMLQVK